MWVTLWYAGVIVMTLGGSEMSDNECETIKNRVQFDITQSYLDPEISAKLISDGFYKENWKVTCESRNLSPEI